MKHALTIFAFLLCATFHAAAAPTPAQEAAFVTRVEKAFTTKDASALLSVYCLDRIDPELRDQIEKQLIPKLLTLDYSSVELIRLPPDIAAPYTARGVTYKPNLKPLKALVIRFRKAPPPALDSMTMIIGMKDHSLAFALPAPISTP